MDLFLLMGLLAVAAVAVYLVRRRRRLDELEREDELLSALDDDHRERDSAWTESLPESEGEEQDEEDDLDHRHRLGPA